MFWRDSGILCWPWSLLLLPSSGVSCWWSGRQCVSDVWPSAFKARLLLPETSHRRTEGAQWKRRGHRTGQGGRGHTAETGGHRLLFSPEHTHNSIDRFLPLWSAMCPLQSYPLCELFWLSPCTFWHLHCPGGRAQMPSKQRLKVWSAIQWLQHEHRIERLEWKAAAAKRTLPHVSSTESAECVCPFWHSLISWHVLLLISLHLCPFHSSNSISLSLLTCAHPSPKPALAHRFILQFYFRFFDIWWCTTRQGLKPTSSSIIFSFRPLRCTELRRRYFFLLHFLSAWYRLSV